MSRYVRANHVNFMSVADIDGKKRAWRKSAIIIKVHGVQSNVQVKTKFYVHSMNRYGAITPGQALVLYDGEYVLGGGTIL